MCGSRKSFPSRVNGVLEAGRSPLTVPFLLLSLNVCKAHVRLSYSFTNRENFLAGFIKEVLHGYVQCICSVYI